METTIKNTTLERGILTSVYKQRMKQGFRKATSKSLSKVKFLVLNHHGNIASQTGTILQVSLFAIVLIAVVF